MTIAILILCAINFALLVALIIVLLKMVESIGTAMDSLNETLGSITKLFGK